MNETERDVMEYEVAIVGAGPAGLACAIRLKQLKPDLSVCVLEKAASLGAHSLSGAVLEPGPLDELLPEWRKHAPAICVPADARRILVHDPPQALQRLPTPPQMAQSRQLHHFARAIGAHPGCQRPKSSASTCSPGLPPPRPCSMRPARSKACASATWALRRMASPGPNFALGPEIHAKITMFCEGCRGSTSKQLIERFKLDAGKSPQTYGLGFKELWQLPPGRVQPGLIQHTLGWPLDNATYGGSFLYHLDNDRVYVGFVVGLDYEDPRFKPFEAFQQ